MFYAFVALVALSLCAALYVGVSFVRNGAYPHNTRCVSAVTADLWSCFAALMLCACAAIRDLQDNAPLLSKPQSSRV